MFYGTTLVVHTMAERPFQPDSPILVANLASRMFRVTRMRYIFAFFRKREVAPMRKAGWACTSWRLRHAVRKRRIACGAGSAHSSWWPCCQSCTPHRPWTLFVQPCKHHGTAGMAASRCGTALRCVSHMCSCVRVCLRVILRRRSRRG
jgi:hypothetical protein